MNRIETRDGALQAQLDRLVGGDLPESERTTLLAWLDEDAARWRACGLAFLEAQMWQEAAAIGPCVSRPEAAESHRITPSSQASGRDGLRVSLLALTAAVALAFLSGAVLARWLPTGVSHPANLIVEQPAPAAAPASDRPLIATVPVKTNMGAHLPLMLQVPVSTDAGTELASQTESVSPYERQRWERRGFEVVEELRYLPARLPDGRQIMVPVNKVQLKFKGTPVS